MVGGGVGSKDRLLQCIGSALEQGGISGQYLPISLSPYLPISLAPMALRIQQVLDILRHGTTDGIQG
jgi:hypothetical protein